MPPVAITTVLPANTITTTATRPTSITTGSAHTTSMTAPVLTVGHPTAATPATLKCPCCGMTLIPANRSRLPPRHGAISFCSLRALSFGSASWRLSSPLRSLSSSTSGPCVPGRKRNSPLPTASLRARSYLRHKSLFS